MQNSNQLCIICFSSADWDNPLWTNKQHIMSRLAKQHKVFYIESLGLRRPLMRHRDIVRIFRRLFNWFKGVRRINDNLYVFSPIVIPFHDNRFVCLLNEAILKYSIKYHLWKHGFKNPVLWTYVPNITGLLGSFGERYVVYHCVDEISQFPGVAKELIEVEKQLLARADITFVTSRNLYDTKRTISSNIHYLPNVADNEHFAQALNEDMPVPAEVRSLPRPVIGFIGAIDDYKVDSEIIAHLSTDGMSVVLIGPLGLTDHAARLHKVVSLPGIHHLGAQPYAVLPAYLKGFDACIIPFRINEYTNNVFPMKFYEYLSAGKPIIATPMPSLKDVAAYVYTAAGPAAFNEAVRKALSEDSPEKQAERTALASQNTWEARIASMMCLIEQTLQHKGL